MSIAGRDRQDYRGSRQAGAAGSPQLSRSLLGVCVALLVMLPPARDWFEQQMLTHMLLQIPLLLFAGGLIGAPAAHALPVARWNLAGVPALFAASLIVAFWMLPITIDHAVGSAGWDAVKGVSLVTAGALAARFWTGAPKVVQAFFGGNLAWMSIAAGQLYQDDGRRLCNAYLLDDQTTTGTGLTWLAVAACALWLVRLASQTASLPRVIRPSPGDGAHEE